MPPFKPVAASEATNSLSHGLSNFDPQFLPLDSDDVMVCRAASPNGDEFPPQSVEPPSRRQRVRKQKDNGKGKGKKRERKPVMKVEEPTVVSLSGHASAPFVSYFLFCGPLLRGIEFSASLTRTIAPPAALCQWARWCIVTDVPMPSTGYVSILRWSQAIFRRVGGSVQHVYRNR